MKDSLDLGLNRRKRGKRTEEEERVDSCHALICIIGWV